MNNPEKILTITYSICFAMGAVACITSGIAWAHWKPTLDQCVGTFGTLKNCSCILYGQFTPSKFLGGNNGSCIFVTFGPLFYLLFLLGMICFHGYRVLFSSASLTRSTHARTIMTKNTAGETVTMTVEAEGESTLPRAFWITLSVFTSIWTLYTLIHFSIFCDGFRTTCNQYRLNLERTLGLHGTALPVLHGRLSCQSIFDFMDYLHIDSGNAYRDGYINTGVDLILGIVASFFSFLLFLVATFVNIKMSRK